MDLVKSPTTGALGKGVPPTPAVPACSRRGRSSGLGWGCSVGTAGRVTVCIRVTVGGVTTETARCQARWGEIEASGVSKVCRPALAACSRPRPGGAPVGSRAPPALRPYPLPWHTCVCTCVTVAARGQACVAHSVQTEPLTCHYTFPAHCLLLDPENPTESCKSRGSNLHVHFKNTHETPQAIKDMHVQKATKYLKDVTLQKPCAKQWGWTQGGWPKESAEFLLHMLKNAQSNAACKGLDVDSQIVEHIQVNKAPKMRRRTYRAHGWNNPYMSSPCHIKMILTEKEQTVPKPEEEVAQKKKITQKKLKKQKLMARE
ncbi:unnamed protein product [Nyctereutes procyonoides]|uniref:Large ribosomal subunit protein uL22 n=1 Tax=Nyctereutes procyonoides TaxID=34880 RepID=A0A811YHN7_NYCPR|nr:unnamed protein product [Nyctereutes procyonoides]